MGERIQIKKNFTCSFPDCSASFSKSWKLEAHNCKHTGLVSSWVLPVEASLTITLDNMRVKFDPFKMDAKGAWFLPNIHHFLSILWIPPFSQKPFPCDDCNKNFCTRYQLTRHQLNHSADRPHKLTSATITHHLKTPVCSLWFVMYFLMNVLLFPPGARLMAVVRHLSAIPVWKTTWIKATIPREKPTRYW